jgi:hypothetical protein
MAIYHCSVKVISRSFGRSATAAAAYRSASKIRDERQGVVHDYTRKSGVVVTGIEVPDGAPDWARDRSALWNAAEKSERRKNSAVAREVEVALPQELDAGQMRRVVEEYSHWLSTRYGVAVDWAIHQPHRRGDARNHHCHILMTTRTMGPDGLGAKVRVLDARDTGPAEVRAMREQWADIVNRSLEHAGLAVRVDHRRLDQQGLAREPQIHAGPSVTAMERKSAAPDPVPLGLMDAIARTGGTTTVGRRLAAIVDLNDLRQKREAAHLAAGANHDAQVHRGAARGTPVAQGVSTTQETMDVHEQRASAAIHDLSSPKLVSSKPARPTAAVDLPDERLAIPAHGRLRINATVLAVTDDAVVLRHAGREKLLPGVPPDHRAKIHPGDRVELSFTDGRLVQMTSNERPGHGQQRGRGPQR